MANSLSRDDRETYKRLISPKRFGKSSRGELPLQDVFASDRSRLIYSSAFRRLQQKTQVFSLSKNAAVRSRLTHTLEVANVGRLIARHLAEDFLKPLGEPWLEAFVIMVETGCLMHDIGNPPFGHFAEVVVQRWFEEHWYNLYRSSVGERMTELSAISRLSNDFLEFDGNPQGIRIITRLQGRTKEERIERGMNLTFSQVLTSLKYLRSPSEPREATVGKPGFFESEADRITRAREELGVRKNQRFPLSYIVEAADDIAYCLSDIEDGIEHGILMAADFFRAINDADLELHRAGFRKLLKISKDSSRRLNRTGSSGRDDFFVFKTIFTPILIQGAARLYRLRHQAIIKGDLPTLFEEGDEETALLGALKKIAGRFLYSSPKVEQPLRLGLKVVSGILDHLGCLLRISRSDFNELIEARRTGDRRQIKAKKGDRELLLYGMLPDRYLEIYEHERAHPRAAKSPEWEWFCRAHLILDYLFGMTDDFALRTYHGLAGIAG